MAGGAAETPCAAAALARFSPSGESSPASEARVTDQPETEARTADQRRGVVIGILISVLIALGTFYYWKLAT